MTTKELIRAEIERRMKELEEQIVDIYDSKAVLRKDELQRLLPFLDTLPDEPVTDCHDLAEAKEEYLRKARMTPGHEWMTRDIEDAFKAGAEWMAKQGVSYQATISADKTIPVLPMKDVSDMGLDYGDKVRIIILPEEG